MTARTIIVLGNPEQGRVSGFCEAARDAGFPSPRVVSWLELCRRGEAALDALTEEEALIRIDSHGGNVEVERALLHRGFDRTVGTKATLLGPEEIAALRPDDHGRIVAPRQAHNGFLAVLDDVERAIARRPGWRALTPIPAVREMFDKRASSRRFAAAGIPAPRAIDVPSSAAELRAALASTGTRDAWVKLTCGSSASCVAAWHDAGGSEALVTTVEIAGSVLYNTKRVRRYADRALIDRVVDFILREGAHVEDGVEKARIAGRWVDLRVLVIAGEPAFVVPRASRTPITNLHLDAERLAVEEVRGRCDEAVFQGAMESCVAIARLYDAFHVGVDLAFTTTFAEHRVLEANAFGDELRRVTRDGLGVYAWQLRHLARVGS